MTGEWSTILYSELENYGTIGAEYYGPAFIRAAKTLHSTNWPLRPLSEVCDLITDGLHGTTEYLDEGVVFILSECVKEGYIALGPSRRISRELHNSLRRSKLKPGDVLVTKTGVYFGKSAVVPESLPESNTIAHVARLVPRAVINPYYLSLFLNTSLGHFQLRRRGIKGTRPEIKLVEFQDIQVPILPPDMQRISEADYRATEDARAQAQRLYAEAEALLLAELGLDDLDLSHQPTYTQNYSQARALGRWDADYWGTEYTTLVDYLKSRPHSSLTDLADFANGATPRGADYLEEGIPFLRIQNVGKNRLELDDVVYIDGETHNELLRRSRLQPGDVLITITGRIGTSAVMPEDMQVGNINQHIVRMRLRNKQTNPYYLAAFLNSQAGRLQTEREAYGTTREALPYYCLERIIVPEAPEVLQKRVEAKIREAEESLQKAKHLLEEAKRRVEEMVLEEE